MYLKLKKTKAIWENEKGEILFREDIYCCDLPRKGDEYIWMHMFLVVDGVTQNLDTGETSIDVITK